MTRTGIVKYRWAWIVILTLLSACSDHGGHSHAAAPPPKGMVLIPAGPFTMGSNKVDKTGMKNEYGFTRPLFLNEHPAHRVFVKAFYIDEYEVTNREYKTFVHETGRLEPSPWIQNGYNVRDEKLKTADISNLRWVARKYFNIDQDPASMPKPALLKVLFDVQHRRDRLPVTGVNWYDAHDYCKWAGKRLPREAEWEKAARGTDKLEYPWGNKWNDHYPNTGTDSQTDNPLAPGGTYTHDESPYGVFDMGGNVTEWVADWYKPYPGSTYKSDLFGEKQKVARGGAASSGHYALSVFYRTARRAHADPTMMSNDLGFRCAESAE